MGYGTGANRIVSFKRQSALGTIATTSGAAQLRRADFSANWNRSTIENPEIRPDRQKAMARGGMATGDLQWSGPVSPGSQSGFWDALVMGAYQSAVTSGALTNVTAAASAPHFMRATGSWITDGFRLGQVIRCTGWTTGGVSNNSRNFIITAITATQLTVSTRDGTAVAAKASGDSVTFTAPGKYCYTPQSSFLDAYMTFDEWSPDVDVGGRDEVWWDARITGGNFKADPNGNLVSQLNMTALAYQKGNAQYFSSPSAISATDVCSTSTGLLVANGTVIGYATGIDFNIDLKPDMPAVVNASKYPFILASQINVTGTLKALWFDDTFDAAFLAETDIGIYAPFFNGPGAAAEFVNIGLPQTRLFSSKKNDGITSTVREYTYIAGPNASAATGTVQSTMFVQDSLAP